ncbi:acetamidase/formamidase family protein [Planococcus lenghuensis]|uniref:Acetamidase n=1 Tax=Planococcus lenghuensis TaxID=2213202 RepID=A0A1Q2KW21_9BACL|nr:acetamidase/formamidase family protein [Planococcus lenghuensis]AQQ52391.1 acetamidase [Planococcus lenghuensis]
MNHIIELTEQNLHGSFSNTYSPILTVASGDSLRLTTPDIQWGYSAHPDQERIIFGSREQEEKPGHPLVGPIAVEGAKPGMVLEIRLNDIVPGWYGRNWAGGNASWQNTKLGITEHERIQLDWRLDTATQTARCEIGGRTFHAGLSPFMGLIATAPAEAGVHRTAPPGYFGGNIDCKELVRGSSLFLPVSVEGALLSIGDGHALQGDGESSGTAIECPMELVDVTLTLHERSSLALPRANTPAGWVTFGFHEDLNSAAGTALNEMVTYMQELYGVSKTEAAALSSVAVDLHITQVVNGVKGVHAILPHGVLR